MVNFHFQAGYFLSLHNTGRWKKGREEGGGGGQGKTGGWPSVEETLQKLTNMKKIPGMLAKAWGL